MTEHRIWQARAGSIRMAWLVLVLNPVRPRQPPGYLSMCLFPIGLCRMVLSCQAAGPFPPPANQVVGILTDESASCGILNEEPAGSGDWVGRGSLGTR